MAFLLRHSSAPTPSPPLEVRVPAFLPFSSTSVIWLYTVLALVTALLVLEQSVYRYKKKHLPGATWTIPLIGKFANSMNPTLENYMAQWDLGALSVVSVFNIFIVMTSSNEYSHKILNSPSHAEPCLLHSGKTILIPDNWVFFTGKRHVEYRKALNTLFTRKALSIYISIQDFITRDYLNKWLVDAAKDPSPKSIMKTARELNMHTSLRVFCGNHIPEEGAIEINQKFWDITRALELVNFPFALPGTKVYKAVQARKAVFKWLKLAAAKSKIAVAEGAEPECLLEQWIKELQSPTHKGRKDFSDRELAIVVFSFLFPSQDAMSSGLIYGFQHLADHPEILAKIREEQYRIRSNDIDKPLTLEMMDRMPYLKAFVKESMRVKPPVTMVPYKTTKAFPITSDYTIPPNTMVIPSFYPSLHDSEVYPDPDRLIPERWLDPDNSANTNPKNYLVFGGGPHKCIGLEYAQLNIGLVLATASVLTNWEHHVTPESDKVQMIATLFPKDGCLLKFTPRPKP